MDCSWEMREQDVQDDSRDGGATSPAGVDTTHSPSGHFLSTRESNPAKGWWVHIGLFRHCYTMSFVSSLFLKITKPKTRPMKR